MESITLSCDLVYNSILNYYVEKFKKKNKEIDIFNLEIRCIFEKGTADKYKLLNKKAFLKKEKKEKRKLFLSSIINMPFMCPVLVTIPILNSDEVHKIKLYNDDIKTILKHYYKDSIIVVFFCLMCFVSLDTHIFMTFFHVSFALTCLLQKDLLHIISRCPVICHQLTGCFGQERPKTH